MCNYEGCERANYKIEDVMEFEYCIFHLPKENVYPDGVNILEKGIHVDGKTVKEFRYKGTEEPIRKDFREALEQYISEVDEKIKNGDKGVFYDFRGFKFHFDEVVFRGKEFRARVDFGGVIFFGSADFKEAKFLEGVNFNGTKFKGNVDFSGAKIKRISEFGFTVFEREATFVMAEFVEKTVFSSCEFEGFANFSGTKFYKELHFEKTQFKGPVDFSGCFFGGYDPLKEQFGKQSNEQSYTTDFEDVKFEDKGRGANFNGAVFKGEIRFIDSVFECASYFIGTKFRDNILFTNFKSADKTVFEDDVSFDLAEFHANAKFFTSFVGSASFRGCQFEGDTYFQGSFQKGADFSLHLSRKKYVYEGEEYRPEDFKQTIFLRSANFLKVEFKGKADFTGVTFEGKASFENTIFSGTIQFKSIRLGGIDFDCIFMGKAIFKDSTFESKAIFEWVKFRNEVNFYKAEFKNKVSFKGTEFGDEKTEKTKQPTYNIIFEYAIFGDYANFENAGFFVGITKKKKSKIGGTEVILSEEIKAINFKNVEFQRDVDFVDVTIDGIMTMINAKFQGNTSFQRCKTKGYSRIQFNEASVNSKLIFIGREGNGEDGLFIILDGVKMASDAEIRFFNYNMTGVIFSGFTEITKLTFRDVKWPRISGRNAIYDEDRFIKEDGLELYKCLYCSALTVNKKEESNICPSCNNNVLDAYDEWNKDFRYDYLISSYELLRKNYETRNGHVEAGGLYIGEMEARKKWLEHREHKTLWENATDWGYRQLIKLYGCFSKYGESTLRPFLWIIAFILFFGVIYDYRNFTNMFFKLSEFNPDQFKDSINNSAHILYQLPADSLKNSMLALIERIIGLLLNALLILSLNRKFRRRD